MVRVVSYEDSRLTGEYRDRATAAKMFFAHVRSFGPESCHIEEDGVELDVVEDCGVTYASLNRLLSSYKHK